MIRMKKFLIGITAISVLMSLGGQTVTAATSQAILDSRSAANSSIVLGYESDGTTQRTVPASNGTSVFHDVPTANAWHSTNGPGSTSHYGIYDYTAQAPCTEAIATNPRVVLGVTNVTPTSGGDYDTSDANTSVSYYFLDDTDEAVPITAADIADGTKFNEYISGTSPFIQDVTRGNSGPSAVFDSGFTLLGTTDATYNGLVNNAAGSTTMRVLVVHTYGGGVLTTDSLTTSDPVLTVDWDESGCATTPVAANPTVSAEPQSGDTLAATGDNQLMIVPALLSLVAAALLSGYYTLRQIKQQ